MRINDPAPRDCPLVRHDPRQTAPCRRVAGQACPHQRCRGATPVALDQADAPVRLIDHLTRRLDAGPDAGPDEHTQWMRRRLEREALALREQCHALTAQLQVVLRALGADDPSPPEHGSAP